uniref:Uncharacterized protein n=1 Tax=Branchiostoma floridae TaxID=7739 RepID=C3XYJ6_BRAFL|eukprot:XP_002610871.1 hypothetical protein BRAFLDRAFT_94875 [Branchiostoma floridae]
MAKAHQLNASLTNNQDLLVTVMQAAPRWKPIDGSMKYVSVGSKGVWGVDHNNATFYRWGTFENEASSGTDWVNVEGQMKNVASGHAVWGLGTDSTIYTRLGQYHFFTPSTFGSLESDLNVLCQPLARDYEIFAE